MKERLIYASEAEANKYEVYEQRKDNFTRLLLKPLGEFDYVHSVLYPENPLMDQAGLAYIVPAIAFECKNILILGAGAGSNIKQLREIGSDYFIKAVELDSEIITISQTVFNVHTSQNVEIIHADAKAYLENNEGLFDYIIVDIFKGNMIPGFCTRTEFFESVNRSLAPNGIMFFNTNLSQLYLADESDLFRNIKCSMFNAGFSSIFYNDLFSMGFIYAFKKSTELESFRLKLFEYFEMKDSNVHLQSAFGTLLLTLQELKYDTNNLKVLHATSVDEYMNPQDACRSSVQKFLELFDKEGPKEQANFLLYQKRLYLYKILSAYDFHHGPVHHKYMDYFRYYSHVLDWASNQDKVGLDMLVDNIVVSDFIFSEDIPFTENSKMVADFITGLSLIRNDQGERAFSFIKNSISKMWARDTKCLY